jgi:MoxR-like ATPase
MEKNNTMNDTKKEIMKFTKDLKINPEVEKEVSYIKERVEKIRNEIGKLVIGQKEVINGFIEALLCNGHVLIEGVPGLAKTLLVRTLAVVTGCAFSRIQFTPDLLPTDIIGITMYEEGKGFYSVKGPVFANFVLADEINRAPPKVQSALLESMQEKQVTIGKETFNLPKPFFVMATQNPVENLGTYSLPEAQVDRFLFKLKMVYPSSDEELDILHNNITTHDFSEFEIMAVLNESEIIKMQNCIKNIYLDSRIERYIISIVDATRNPKKYSVETGRFIQFGGSPRSSIALFIAAKAHAAINGRVYVIPDDVKDVAHNVLRHRILLNYEGQAEEIKTETIIDEILKKVPVF